MSDLNLSSAMAGLPSGTERRFQDAASGASGIVGPGQVTFRDLRDAKPKLWQVAADDLAQLAREAEQAASDIYDQGKRAVDQHWTDEVGQRAAGKLKELANTYEVTAITVRGVVSVLDGLSTGAEITQKSLLSAIAFGIHSGLELDDTGAVRVPPGNTDPLAERYAQQVRELIGDTVRRANELDQDAAAALSKLTAAVTNTDLDRALNTVQAAATTDQLALIRASLPIGASPADVVAWWNSLTPEQHAELERAVPVELYDLAGIPQDVKDRLVGGYGYNRVELVRWAQQNWTNTDIDLFDNNCAHFASTALEHAGLQPKGLITWQGDAWGHGRQTGWDWFDAHIHSHTDTWADSDAQRDFFLGHGGQSVPLSETRPGDLVYFEQQGTGGDVPDAPGRVHHTAIVTSVTPDGDIHYTQHSDPRINVSLNGRLPHNEIIEGAQKIVVVRVNPDWYPH